MQLHEFQTSYGFQSSPCVLVSAQSCSTLCSPMDCPWDFPDKNSGVGCHLPFQGVFPTQVLHDLLQLTPSELSPPFCPYSLHIHILLLSVPIQVAPTSGTLHCLFPRLEHPAWDLSVCLHSGEDSNVNSSMKTSLFTPTPHYLALFSS